MNRTIIAAALALAGCGSVPLPTEEMQPPTRVILPGLMVPDSAKGRVTVKRDLGKPTGCTYHIYVDGSHALEIQHRQGATLYLSPGEHVLSLRNSWACNSGDSEIAIVADAKREKVVRITTDSEARNSLQQSALSP